MDDFDGKNPFETDGSWEKEDPFANSSDLPQAPEDGNPNGGNGYGGAFDEYPGKNSNEIPTFEQKPEPPKANGLAITSLVLGIIGAVFSMICCCPLFTAALGLILGIAAIVTGILAFTKTKSKMALAGLILGAIAAVIGMIFVIYWGINWPLLKEEIRKILEQGGGYPYDSTGGGSSGGIGDFVVGMLARLVALIG